MFSVVSRCTSESSSQGWFFSCHAHRVSLATKGGTVGRKGGGFTGRGNTVAGVLFPQNNSFHIVKKIFKGSFTVTNPKVEVIFTPYPR